MIIFHIKNLVIKDLNRIMATISPGSIAPLQLSNVLMNHQNNESSSSSSGSVPTSAKPSSTEDSRVTLLQKIGKVGDAPSKTGLNLHDAEAISAFVIANMVRWRQELTRMYVNQGNRGNIGRPLIVAHKKSKENNLPRTLLIGFQEISGGYRMGTDGNPHMRIVVLCKCKVSATEHPDEKVAKAAKPTDPVSKVNPVGQGTNRVIKAALDWLSGEMLVEVLSKKTQPPSDLTGHTINEIEILGRLAGSPGIVQAPFMARLIANNSRYSYLMHRYKGTLAMELKSTHPVPLKSMLAWMKSLSAGLCAMKEGEIVHNDSKGDNTLVHEDNTAGFADFDLACSLEKYKREVSKRKVPKGSPVYYPPEIWQFMLKPDNGNMNKLLFNGPFAKDMWATGWQFAELLARKCSDSSKSFDDFQTQMLQIADTVHIIIKRQENRNGFSFKNSDVYNFVTKFIDKLKAGVENNTSLKGNEKDIATKLVEITRDMLQVDVVNRLTAEQLKVRLNALSY